MSLLTGLIYGHVEHFILPQVLQGCFLMKKMNIGVIFIVVVVVVTTITLSF